MNQKEAGCARLLLCAVAGSAGCLKFRICLEIDGVLCYIILVIVWEAARGESVYLKALEIQGFKSFPDKTVLNFGEDITAIVGPNGSGKSNISDAIRWVMGEQSSKSLRGAKMEDVIFGGTAKRVQVGFAQVTLVIDNTEHIFPTMEESEVSVTRRYYRSGESEYYINRESVRLKDINSLLMDTGLGRDGYSIIGQGRIADIVSTKSTDRREVFEEAAGISRFRYRKEEAERKLEKTEENLLRINDKIEELEMQVGPLKKQAETAKRYLVLRDELRVKEISVWMETLDKLHAQAEAIALEYSQTTGELEKAREELKALYASSGSISERMHQKDVETEQARERLSAAESAAAECDSAAAVLRANVKSSTESMQRMLSDIAQQETRAAEIQSQMDEGNKRIAQIGQELKALEEQTKQNNNVLDGCRMKLKSREDMVNQLSDKVTQLAVDGRSMDSRIHMLSEMEKDYEGYSKAVKQVMQARNTLRGIHGPVANLMKTEQQYSVAIEIALGAGLQNIVVDREEDAKAAINFLKQRDGGRATFLPLTAIRGDELRQAGLENETGYVGIASRLVRFDPKYRNIFENLLGRTVVAEDLDCGIAMARKYQNRFRIVTLDGQVINRGGSMTGGSVNRNAGVLSRAAELEKLRSRSGKLHETLNDAVRQEEDVNRELSAAQYELETAEGQRRQAEDEVLRLEGLKNHYAILIENLENSLENLSGELSALDGRLKDNEARLKAAADTVAAQEAAAADCRRQAEERLSGQTELLEQSNRLSETVTEKKSALAALTAEKDATARSLEDLETLRRQLTGDKSEKERQAAAYQRNIDEAQAQIRTHRQTLEALHAQSQAFRDRLTALNQEKLTLEAERTARNKAGQEMNETLLDMERMVSHLEQKKTAAAMEEKQILDRLWEHYELSHSAAQAQRLELESISKANRRIGELKRDISALGTPNIGAIEEFDRVNTRYTYLTDQRNDVEKAKGELEGVIREITEQMTGIFAQQFQLLNESFQTTFQELFGGGQATLELEDEKDILNCGIEIRAQPPGKTLKNISLLSGGEKAFVAIALYFAILKVHPTPFCVMDEIEAALDEPNVIRVARYMRRLAGRTQFIVITHRRGTMEEADVLYGVTMQEQGVSKILTINLNDMAKELKIE